MLISGDFGELGGNGESAASAGVALYKTPTANWLLFGKEGERERIVHRGNIEIDQVVSELESFTGEVKKKWEESKGIKFEQSVYAAYLEQQAPKLDVKKVLKGFLEGMIDKDNLSLADFVWSMTGKMHYGDSRALSNISDTTKLNLEYAASELIMNPELVVERGKKKEKK